jgi:hypothetical protein
LSFASINLTGYTYFLTGGMGVFKLVLSGAGIIVPGVDFAGAEVAGDGSASKRMMAFDESVVHD